MDGRERSRRIDDDPVSIHLQGGFAMNRPVSVDRDEQEFVGGGSDEIPAVDVEQFRIQDQAAYAREIANGNVVLIFDTTLRDGEQSPGATLNLSLIHI